jgi:2-succinyl-5-enolpyruvyl-6-hydroxy-3-cyclohexene-1-carboxylate synthase
MRSRVTEPSGVREQAPGVEAHGQEARGAEARGALNVTWADRFVLALHAAGVREAIVCSGSRSAPLAIAFGRSPIETRVSLDERSAGFFALGLAKAARRPVAIVCTSGSAAANFLPAVVEASSARVPLIVVTADRPPELRDTGAPQTIDQIKLFGDLVRWFVEVGVPEDSRPMLDYVSSLGTRAAAEAWKAPAGPVHLNFAFREPLLPSPDALPPLPSRGPETHVAPEPLQAPPRQIERLAKLIRSLRRGLIVCGPDEGAPELAPRIQRLAEITGYPVLADPASQLRYGHPAQSPILGAYDAFLRSSAFADRFGPEIVIQLGAALTSKAFHGYAARHPATVHVIVDPAQGWRSPARRGRERIAADPAEAAAALLAALEGTADPMPSWRQDFDRAEQVAREAIGRHLEGAEPFEEGAIFPVLLSIFPESGTLYVGNSMAIRDLDTFVPDHPRRHRVLTNRGASGIDGVLSSALGASVVPEDPLLLVIGDLSFHMDLNALHMVREGREGRVRATVVVVNNDGGGIFSFLPAARHADFERWFGTPHGLTFESAAALYGLPYSQPRSWEELKQRAGASLRARTTEVIEIRTDREKNRAWHQALWDDVVRDIGRTFA